MNTLAPVDAPDLKQWMSENGWTVRTLADALGVGHRTVGRWRDGSSRVPPMARLALQALGPRSDPIPDKQEYRPDPERVPVED